MYVRAPFAEQLIQTKENERVYGDSTCVFTSAIYIIYIFIQMVFVYESFKIILLKTFYKLKLQY